MAFFIPSFRGSKYKPTVARPHPPVDHTFPMAAFALAFGTVLAWVAELSFPYAVGVIVVVTLVSALLTRRAQRKIALEPSTDLFMPGPVWVGVVAAIAAAVAAYDLEQRASSTAWLSSMIAATVGGALLSMVPSVLVASALANRAAEGGPLPPRSRARKAVALAPWRSVCSAFALFNVGTSLPAMAHTKSPLTNVGSAVALGCALLVTYVVVAQQAYLRPREAAQVTPPAGPVYRVATPRPEHDEVPDDTRTTAARRELVRGIMAFVIAWAVLAFHAFVLFG